MSEQRILGASWPSLRISPGVGCAKGSIMASILEWVSANRTLILIVLGSAIGALMLYAAIANEVYRRRQRREEDAQLDHEKLARYDAMFKRVRHSKPRPS